MSYLAVFAQVYLTIAALAFLPRLLLPSETIFPFVPPFNVLKLRLWAIVSRNHMPMKSRILLLVRYILFLSNQVIWGFLWTIDDFIFSSYRNMNMDNAVFVMGGFRTGSTSLHRTIGLDEDRFVSPRILEITFPFLTLHYFLDCLEWCDKNWGTAFIKGIDNGFAKILGKDVLLRHPMSYYAAEEDDLIFSSIYLCGYYSGCQFPERVTWLTLGQMSKFTDIEKERCFNLYKRINQKVLYRRGGGRTLLAKSHLIEFVDVLHEKLPESKFVDIVRHPKDSIGSWLGLCTAANKFFTKCSFPREEAIAVHLEFWDLYLQKEVDVFNGKPDASLPEKEANRKLQLTFKEYVGDPVGTAAFLYNKWGFPYEGTQFQKACEASMRKHKEYKNHHKYHNPSLEDMDLTLKDVETRYRTYLDTVKV